MKVHGITNASLTDKPKFSAVVDDLLTFIKGAEVLIHNAAFDLSFLDGELNLISPRHGKISDYCKITDTLAMARELHPSQRNSLDAVCKRYGIDNSQRDLHGALLDAKLLALAYLAMTAGQNSLFVDSESNTEAQTTIAQQQMAIYPDKLLTLPLLLASAEEVAAHLESLQRISQSNGGKCLWL
jgi:DNA polymerase-3 subunit epsilon